MKRRVAAALAALALSVGVGTVVVPAAFASPGCDKPGVCPRPPSGPTPDWWPWW